MRRGSISSFIGKLKDDVSKRVAVVNEWHASPSHHSLISSHFDSSPLSKKSELLSVDELKGESIATPSSFLSTLKQFIVDDPTQIRVKVHQKQRELGSISLIQNIKSSDDPKSQITCMRFNKTGTYLAVSSLDTILRIYLYSQNQLTLYRSYLGHTAPITDLSWSRNNFLISASVDQTVRCWHISDPECLCAFKHPQPVTSVAFHPLDDRFFLSGCKDSRIRLWSLSNKSIFQWNELSQKSSITAVAYNKDGTLVICGSASGDLIFYDAYTLKYNTQISIVQGKKAFRVTGIEYVRDDFEDWIVVSACDSRIRLYNLRDKSLVRRYRGLEITTSKIKAQLSPDGKYIICGSEDKHVYMFGTLDSKTAQNAFMPRQADTSRSSSYEKFQTSDSIVTCAVFAPLSLSPEYIADTGLTNEVHSLVPLKGVVIITGDAQGNIKVFQNTVTDDMLKEDELQKSKALSRSNSNNAVSMKSQAFDTVIDKLKPKQPRPSSLIKPKEDVSSVEIVADIDDAEESYFREQGADESMESNLDTTDLLASFPAVATDVGDEASDHADDMQGSFVRPGIKYGDTFKKHESRRKSSFGSSQKPSIQQ